MFNDKNMYYKPFDIAKTLINMNLDVKYEAVVIEEIFIHDDPFIDEEYSYNKKNFIMDIMMSKHYYNNKKYFLKEDNSLYSNINKKNIANESNEGDFFFKNTRLRLRFGMETYVRIKFRTLLKKYGKKRKSKNIIKHMEYCMEYYCLKANYDLNKVDIDKVISFKLNIHNL